LFNLILLINKNILNLKHKSDSAYYFIYLFIYFFLCMRVCGPLRVCVCLLGRNNCLAKGPVSVSSCWNVTWLASPAAICGAKRAVAVTCSGMVCMKLCGNCCIFKWARVNSCWKVYNHKFVWSFCQRLWFGDQEQKLCSKFWTDDVFPGQICWNEGHCAF